MIKILIIEDHSLVRKGLMQILQQEKDIQVIGAADKGLQGIQLVRKMHPQVVLLDIKLPDISGIEVAHRLLGINTSLKILILTSVMNDLFSSRLIKSGVSGYLNKDTEKEVLIDTIKSISNNKIAPLSKIFKQLSADKALQTLSNREIEVMFMMVKNQSVTAIAEDLFIDKKTVYTYRSNVYKKLNVKNNVSLIRLLIQLQVIHPEEIQFLMP